MFPRCLTPKDAFKSTKYLKGSVSGHSSVGQRVNRSQTLLKSAQLNFYPIAS